MCEEIAILISSCIRLSPPDAVTNNVVMAVVHRIVMLYHIGRLRAPPVAIVRAVKTRKMALSDWRPTMAAYLRSLTARAALEKVEHGSQRDVPKNRRFNREMEAAFPQELPDNATVCGDGYGYATRQTSDTCDTANEWTRWRHGLHATCICVLTTGVEVRGQCATLSGSLSETAWRALQRKPNDEDSPIPLSQRPRSPGLLSIGVVLSPGSISSAPAVVDSRLSTSRLSQVLP